jgi:putative addiction module killer protein
LAYKIQRTEEFIHWLSELPEKLKLQVTARLARIRLYDHFGDKNTLGDGLFELKWKSGLRVYYVHKDRFEITLLLGGEKHGQDKDIKKAKRLIGG